MEKRKPADLSWSHGFCDVCGWYASHFYGDGSKFCCEHHIKRGGIPADFHRDCMEWTKKEHHEKT